MCKELDSYWLSIIGSFNALCPRPRRSQMSPGQTTARKKGTRRRKIGGDQSREQMQQKHPYHADNEAGPVAGAEAAADGRITAHDPTVQVRHNGRLSDAGEFATAMERVRAERRRSSVSAGQEQVQGHGQAMSSGNGSGSGSKFVKKFLGLFSAGAASEDSSPVSSPSRFRQRTQQRQTQRPLQRQQSQAQRRQQRSIIMGSNQDNASVGEADDPESSTRAERRRRRERVHDERSGAGERDGDKAWGSDGSSSSGSSSDDDDDNGNDAAGGKGGKGGGIGQVGGRRAEANGTLSGVSEILAADLAVDGLGAAGEEEKKKRPPRVLRVDQYGPPRYGLSLASWLLLVLARQAVEEALISLDMGKYIVAERKVKESTKSSSAAAGVAGVIGRRGEAGGAFNAEMLQNTLHVPFETLSEDEEEEDDRSVGGQGISRSASSALGQQEGLNSSGVQSGSHHSPQAAAAGEQDAGVIPPRRGRRRGGRRGHVSPLRLPGYDDDDEDDGYGRSSYPTGGGGGGGVVTASPAAGHSSSFMSNDSSHNEGSAYDVDAYDSRSLF